MLFAAQSEYFDALLSNTFSNSQPINHNNNNNNIDNNKATFYEPDVSIETFEFVKKYCYGIHDQLYITATNVFGIYYASRKYLINYLASKCEQCIDCIVSANSTTVNDIIKLYFGAIERSCPTLADKMEVKLKEKARNGDNMQILLTFMDLFNQIVNNSKQDENTCTSFRMRRRDQRVFSMLLFGLLRRRIHRVNQDNATTILLLCKNSIIWLPHQLFLRWFVENQLFDVKKQKIRDICVKYCKHFVSHVQKAKEKPEKNRNDINNDSNNNYNNNSDSYHNSSVLSLDSGDEVDITNNDEKKMTTLQLRKRFGKCSNNLQLDCDYVDDLETFDYQCWQEMFNQLFAPSIHIL